ncbi:MAG: hypothetical protein HY722_13380 [Planctomycetes bacterium]|nr:hypothetical protein [Planctomycetota bacterium]
MRRPRLRHPVALVLGVLLWGCGSSSGTTAGVPWPPAPGTVPSPSTARVGRFVAGPALNGARFFHAQALLPGGRVFLAGGLFLASPPLPRIDAEVLDLATGLASTVAPPPGIHFQCEVVPLAGGALLLVGGDPGGVVSRYDPMTGAFTRAAVLRVPRVGCTATALVGGEILVAGGLEPRLSAGGLGFTALDSIERLDPVTGSSRASAARLAGPRVGHTATRLGSGRVLLVGGHPGRETASYDPAVDRVAAGPSLALGREDHRVTPLPSGALLVSGGSDGGGRSLDSLEVLDPLGVAFRLLGGRMGRGREDHSATLLADGRVLLAGGEDNGAGPLGDDVVLGDAWLVDPVRDEVRPAGTLTRPRDDHRANLLSDGRVLLAGGEDGDGRAIGDVEFYVP